MRPSPRSLLSLLLASSPLLAASPLLARTPLKIDFSYPARSDAIAPFFEQWTIDGGKSPQKKIGDVTFTLSQHGSIGRGLKSVWWKGGLADGNRMAIDGVMVDEGDKGGSLELRIGGLTPGPHSLVTYHNYAEDDHKSPFGKIDVSVDGKIQAAGVTPTHRATDETAAFAYLTFTATAGQDVVIVFSPSSEKDDSSAKRRNVVLCGLELDTSDPAKRARDPSPMHGDRHADADTAPLTLAWHPAASAVAHQVYLGSDAQTVATATPDSPAFRGKTASASFTAADRDPLQQYYWRIDEVDAAGAVTPGPLWSFQPRRIAFPGAEGWGRFAIGGRGGRVIEVTNLNDAGPGSLRAAVEADGPRTVVFAVSGLITLESKLPVRNPYLTIAGQTAPGKGITVRKYNLGLLGAHDVIIRDIRVRPGNIAGITIDGMGMAASRDSIFDHCSISWSIDEAFSSRGAKNITLQRTLISEALNSAGHKNYKPGKPHGYAASIGGDVGSFHHNLLAHNYGRNWSLAGGLSAADGSFTGRFDITNNVVYNWGHRATDGGGMEVNFVNNYYQPGPSTDFFYALNAQYDNFPGMQRYYFSGNVMPGHFDEKSQKKGRTSTATNGGHLPKYKNFVDEPFFPSYVTTQSARAAYKIVLSDVGANAPLLDDHDQRIIAETLQGGYTYKGSKTGLAGMPDSQEDVGGWEDYPEVHRPDTWDSDHDGIPDWWEKIHASNPASPKNDYSDAHTDRDGNGFGELEDYLAWMAAPHIAMKAGTSYELDAARLTAGFTQKPVYKVTGATHGELTLLPDGKIVRFTPAANFTGLASFALTVTDAEGDSMSRTVGVLVQ